MGGARKRSVSRRAAAGIPEDPRRQRQRQRQRRRRRNVAEEEEGRSRRRGGVGGSSDGGPAAGHGRRAIHDPDCDAYDILVGRGKAPVLCGTRRIGGNSLPRQEGGRLRAGQAGGGGHCRSGAVNLLN